MSGVCLCSARARSSRAASPDWLELSVVMAIRISTAVVSRVGMGIYGDSILAAAVSAAAPARTADIGLDRSDIAGVRSSKRDRSHFPGRSAAMIQAFVITLREGLEAFLIVAISLAYLRKSGRAALIPAIHWGIGVSILLSIGAGVLLAQANNQALWEGVLAVVAALLVASLTTHMWRAGKRMKKEIEGRLEASSLKTGRAAFLGVFGFTLLMI